MSACTSVPAFGCVSQWRSYRRTTLTRSEKSSLGFLLLSLGICIATRGAVGTELLAVAMLCSFFFLPLEYVVGSLALGALLPTLLGALPVWYIDWGRWFLIFGGAAIVWFRLRPSHRLSRSTPVSLFRVLFVTYAAVAGVTIFTSTSPSLSAAKWLVLLVGLVMFRSYSQWLVSTRGGSAAAVWVRGWLFVLAPVLIGNTAAVLWGMEGSTAGSSLRGVAGNANSLGAIVALALPLLVCQFLYRRRRSSVLVQSYGILIVSGLFMLYASWSRASVGAFLVGMAVLLWIHPINRLNRFAVLGSLLLFAAFVMRPEGTLRSFESWLYKGRAEETLLAARSDQWELGYQNFRERPLLGIGFGVTAAAEEQWDLESFRYLKVEQGSSLSALLGQIGLVGSVPIYLGIIWLLLRSLHYARRVRDPWLSGVVAAGFVGFVNSFFEGWLAAPASGLYWFVVFQLFFLDAVMTSLKPPGRSSWFPVTSRPRTFVPHSTAVGYSRHAHHRPAAPTGQLRG